MRFDMRALRRRSRPERSRLAAPSVARARLLMAVLATHVWWPRHENGNGAVGVDEGAAPEADTIAGTAPPAPVLADPIVWQGDDRPDPVSDPLFEPRPSPREPNVIVPRLRWHQVARAVRTFV
ncbi:MAG TPA: hypothetical protein VF152_16030, partial [Acidimicrobiia bacterium]